jgi:hypothetical protein
MIRLKHAHLSAKPKSNDQKYCNNILSKSRSYATDSKPFGYWNNKANQRAFFDQLAVELQINKLSDWLKVPAMVIQKKGGWFIKKYYYGNVIRGK